MSSRNYCGQGGVPGNDVWPTLIRNINSNYISNNGNPHGNFLGHTYSGSGSHNDQNAVPFMKKRKFSDSGWEGYSERPYQELNTIGNNPSTSNSSFPVPTRPHVYAARVPTGGIKRSRAELEDNVVFMSKDEIERLSPSRKDGIDSLRETHLRYSYCSFLQNLGMRLELPQTTIGSAMVLCHRFFVRRSHVCHDRFLIATAALFLAAKSEETLRPLNDVLRASCEICHKQDLSFFPSLLPVDWFEQYRDRVTQAEHMILTTLDFELNVQHPYVPLTSALNKLGLSQNVLLNLALNLVSEGRSIEQCSMVAALPSWLRSSLWLQFKPHHIAAGAAYLAAKLLNFDLASNQRMWQEFETTPSILQDVVHQLTELF
ncbi:hypothetical protein GIB67_036464 [Kingdonia uniflora]|uniref:Cyclin-like domain-containing protein n=1 Tax=Kingdonia uniflora TaxID=39325 RepID=A0A7J7MH81_9MAGN|nr:hypothetical protein GIB67_036464 [Kingdonia uniflora]